MVKRAALWGAELVLACGLVSGCELDDEAATSLPVADVPAAPASAGGPPQAGVQAGSQAGVQAPVATGGVPIVPQSGGMLAPAPGSGGTGGGSSPTGGVAGDDSDAGADQPPVVEPGGLQCAAEVCAPLPDVPPEAAALGFALELCCADTGVCGTSLNGGACTVMPDSDPSCPPIDVMGFSVASCCTADGRCGLDGSLLMMPCTSLEDAAVMVAGLIELPPPQACTPGG